MKKILILMPLLFSLPSFAAGVAACKVSVHPNKGSDIVLNADVKDLAVSETPAVSTSIASSCPASIAFSPTDSETLVFSIERVEKSGKQVVCDYTTLQSRSGSIAHLLCLAN